MSSLLSMVGTNPVVAATRSGCLEFIPAAERYFALPPGLLAAIAITESGRRGVPQAWAINVGGVAVLPATADAAAALLRGADGSPRRDVAVGCLQVHMKYHLDRFGAPERALDPAINIWVGAAVLAQLHDRYGAWQDAVGHYYASNPSAQRAYRCTVARQWRSSDPAAWMLVAGFRARDCRGLDRTGSVIGAPHHRADAGREAERRIGKIIVLRGARVPAIDPSAR